MIVTTTYGDKDFAKIARYWLFETPVYVQKFCLNGQIYIRFFWRQVILPSLLPQVISPSAVKTASGGGADTLTLRFVR